MSSSIQVVILAAGKSTRFKTSTSKLLEKLCGQEMILYPARLFSDMHMPITFITGFQSDKIKQVVSSNIETKVEFIAQTELLGTGHALLQSKESWAKDHILVINGDCPLLSQNIIETLIDKHLNTQAVLTFVTAHNADPSNNYGRVVKQENMYKIIEASEQNSLNRYGELPWINAGIYLIKKTFLLEAIQKLTPNPTTGEVYITDLVELAGMQRLRVETINAPFDSIRGVNTPKELWSAEHIKRSELICYWMSQGVIFSFAQSTHIDIDVTIEAGSMIAAGAHILRGTRIGKLCHIGPFNILENTIVGDFSRIESHCVVEDSFISEHVHVGPFTHIRKNSTIQSHCTIGNFVEVSNSTIKQHSKAKHLAYLGNTQVGKYVNIGAGTITCNFDGQKKNTTIIHDEAFIGSNNTLIAPVTIGEKSYTAAGSIINKDVPKESLAIGRARQTNKQNYMAKECNENSNDLFFGAIKTSNQDTKEE